jgi:hypothetical protein
MGGVLSALARVFGRDPAVPCVQGLEVDGVARIKPFVPPYYPSMEAAVRAVVDRKVGPSGIFRAGAVHSAWLDPARIAEAPAPSAAAIAATIAYCEYVYGRYGRFPAYPPPLRTLLGFQVNHLDTDFYDRFYRPEALAAEQRRHMETWHPEMS